MSVYGRLIALFPLFESTTAPRMPRLMSFIPRRVSPFRMCAALLFELHDACGQSSKGWVRASYFIP